MCGLIPIGPTLNQVGSCGSTALACLSSKRFVWYSNCLNQYILVLKKEKSSLETMENLSKANVMSVLTTLFLFFILLLIEAN